MSSFLDKVFKRNSFVSKDEIAKLLQIKPELYEQFEKAYENRAIKDDVSLNAKDVAREKEGIELTKDIAEVNKTVSNLVDRIVKELVSGTKSYVYTKKDGGEYHTYLSDQSRDRVTNSEITAIPYEELRPQLTGSLMQIDADKNASESLLYFYNRYLKERNPKRKREFYHMFRQGLDILNYDWLMYEMIGTNPNSMGHWFPEFAKAVNMQHFFKIPDTTIIKVPMPILQMTRIGYESCTRTTLDIIDQYCKQVFGLDEEKEYFIKTGTYSSKFDFRNAYVHGAKEVRELGEYLLFIHSQANQMASPLCKPSIYGMSTTNEWVVREFIPDKENSPCIYEGLPLHTEYRVFVDFDTNEILGISPYWRPDVMKQRFGHEADSEDPHNVHDYIVYTSYESFLMKRYEENKDKVLKHMENMVSDVELTGQWSIDIMQNGDDFYLIDAALAENSALVDCVPKEKLKHVEENWLPRLEG